MSFPLLPIEHIFPAHTHMLPETIKEQNKQVLTRSLNEVNRHVWSFFKSAFKKKRVSPPRDFFLLIIPLSLLKQ